MCGAVDHYGRERDAPRTPISCGNAEKLVLHLLTRRFGSLPPDVAARVAAASIDELDAVGERLLAATSLEEALAAGG